MLSSTQREKIRGHYQWDKPSQKADFNYDMGQKLEQRLRDLPDLVLLMEYLPDKVLENIDLISYLRIPINLRNPSMKKFIY